MTPSYWLALMFAVLLEATASTETLDRTCENTDSASCASVSQGEESKDDAPDQECGIWVGLSSLPGTGIGMYAGKDFSQGDPMMDVGDVAIPIVDLKRDHPHESFLWSEYTWDAEWFGMTRMAHVAVDVASPGFGATANSFMDFLNVQEDESAVYSNHGLHRSRDPQAGAFTYFHSRMSYSYHHIPAGQELFVTYGDSWFTGRVEKIGVIPITGDHSKAERLYLDFASKASNQISDAVKTDFWDTLVLGLKSIWESSILAALPDKDDYDDLVEVGLIELKKRKMKRSPEWLQKHAVCADNFYFGVSTIPKAGNGVFAGRKLQKGSAVLPVPVIHIPEASILDMGEANDSEGPKRKQLLLNYCLGHRDSSLLLSPYGPAFNLVNHNQSLANVRLQWALPERSNHDPELLNKTVDGLSDLSSSKIALELIALRDIEPGEEIFLDYGDDFEDAWQYHLESFVPGLEADYVSARDYNLKQETLRTEFEQAKDPYPSNLALVFKQGFAANLPYRDDAQKGNYKDVKFKVGVATGKTCEILRKADKDGKHAYAAVLHDNKDSSKDILIENMPREAFEFQDRAYTEDFFLESAFRHPIHIPDVIFPEAWKNRI